MRTVVAASFLCTALLITASASPPPVPVFAAPAQLFGRDNPKQDKSRLLMGKVLDASDNPVANAVVYLTNTHTRSVKTYIVGTDGAYRFPALQPGIDYEVYAQLDDRKSGTKTVSQFDDRTQVSINLKIKSR